MIGVFFFFKVSDLIEEYHREDITYWGSFNDTICQKLTAQVGQKDGMRID